MARGFRGMKDDFMELINHIIELSCCSIAHDDNFDAQLIPLPPPTVGDFSFLEVRDDVVMKDDHSSTLACTGVVVDEEYVVIDEGLDPGFAAVRNPLLPTFEDDENFWTGYNASLNIKLYEHDSESLSSSQIEKEKNSSPKILEGNSSSMPPTIEEEEEASDIEDCYLYSQKEGEDVCIQKHILVEDYLPSISLSDGLQLRKRTNKNNLDDEEIRDSHEVDSFQYVFV